MYLSTWSSDIQADAAHFECSFVYLQSLTVFGSQRNYTHAEKMRHLYFAAAFMIVTCFAIYSFDSHTSLTRFSNIRMNVNGHRKQKKNI